MTKTEALRIFVVDIIPDLPHQDKVAVRCAWNDWTDSLHKDGCITTRQNETWTNPFDR